MSDCKYPLETVYKHEHKEKVHIEKPPRYTSKFRTTVLREEKQNKCAMRTMGPANVEVPAPDKYLLKHSKEPKRPEKKVFSAVSPKTSAFRRPPVPLRTEKPLMGLKTKRDFVKTAHKDIVLKVPLPIYADTKRGDKHLLENSGLVPKYRKKKDYGQTPRYVQQRITESLQAKEDHEKDLEEQRRKKALKQLTEEERQAILEGLKKEWTEMTRQYLTLPFRIITYATKDRKDRLEKGLKELEADIDIFEAHKFICIGN
ncbi:enkurin-like [Genypterus blacodes]|uniref:enkurin-like n=1 Tax=Genypterus blacodes TaxID=154954 RepID=UPI003F7778F9